MFVKVSLKEQVEKQRADRLRVLVVGAGVAGLTLAQLLRRGGLNPVLIERASDNADEGYMLALMPLVDPAMQALGVKDEYRAGSVPFHHYRLHGHNGPLLREYEIDTLLDAYGDYRGLARGELLEVLATHGAPISRGATLKSIQQTAKAVETVLQDGNGTVEATFDAVVLADGLHSESRAMLLDASQVTTYDTDWAGWVAWTETDAAHADQGDEIWGADFFVGIYPVKGRAGVFVGGDRADMREGPAAFIAHIRSQLTTVDPWFERALATVQAGKDLYFWKLTDCRADTWVVGRVALVGDAAAGFLPTAGIGAGMAMESATVLARHLLDAGPEDVGEALQAYEHAQRPRAEAAQDNSRQLAKLMFRHSRALAVIRDLAVRLVPLATVLGPIRKLLDHRPISA
ncbi:NAD(P)/FAD-dependent oxidoreductase [Mesorhizobium sp. 8]|uniref:FAD-dependent oxidoreductase n=1 Tax=Mesorhizobium sp. 8 TaxID=2584466 RepID=UPI00111F6102|nr:NAD(P)/FAD-dependent oxidoreductase [Mesorhizobium sp. 8]QDC01623.1 FAD-dependent monooxygenase [Mesorhizobium sp. 8]